MEEKKYEYRLIKELRKAGFYASHIDSSIPGFPDIFSIYKGKIILIEVKDIDRAKTPRTAFESSQPQLYYTFKGKYGFENLFVVFGNKNGGYLYTTLFADSMMHLDGKVEGSYWVITDWIKEHIV